MFASNDIYLFFDRANDELLFEKQSKTIDCTFDCADFYSVKKTKEFLSSKAVDNEKLRLIQHKVKVALWVRGIFEVIREGIEKDFSKESLAEIPIDEKNVASFEKLMREERAILEERIAVNRQRFEDAILNAKSVEDVDSEFLLMRKHVQIGIYSPIERERRKSDGLY